MRAVLRRAGLRRPARLEQLIAEEADTADSDTALSYSEWHDAGYCVIRGSKSRLRDAVGTPQFTLDQVTKL